LQQFATFLNRETTGHGQVR